MIIFLKNILPTQFLLELPPIPLFLIAIQANFLKIAGMKILLNKY